MAAAKRDYPNSKILIKAHAETVSSLRPGYFSAADETVDVQILSQTRSPWRLFKAQKQSIRILPKWALKPSLPGINQMSLAILSMPVGGCLMTCRRLVAAATH